MGIAQPWDVHVSLRRPWTSCIRQGEAEFARNLVLPYLTPFEKLNCVYCSYATGVVAYVREVTARTEQYWCPIRHARPIRSPHGRDRAFVDCGDASAYRRRLPAFRNERRHARRRRRVGHDEP